MTETKAILAIAAGCTFVVLSFTTKQFYAGPALVRKIPRWQGRVLFLVVGSAFVLVGISFFFRGQQ